MRAESIVDAQGRCLGNLRASRRSRRLRGDSLQHLLGEILPKCIVVPTFDGVRGALNMC